MGTSLGPMNLHGHGVFAMFGAALMSALRTSLVGNYPRWAASKEIVGHLSVKDAFFALPAASKWMQSTFHEVVPGGQRIQLQDVTGPRWVDQKKRKDQNKSYKTADGRKWWNLYILDNFYLLYIVHDYV